MSNPNTKPGMLEKAQSRLSDLTSTLTSTLTTTTTPPDTTKEYTFPPFHALPRIPNQPHGCLWSFFGPTDDLGTLNLLTPSTILAARSEIQTGQHVQLDACLSSHVQFPGFGRKKFEQKIIEGKGHAGFDDEVSFNTQSGSQWDGLKHYAHQRSGMYYNGLKHEEAREEGDSRNGIHKWIERGGIVGRGVLVDWVRWLERDGAKAPSAVSRYEIPVKELEECLKWQGTETRQGDILIVRSGYMRWHNEASEEERKRGTQENSTAIGVENQERAVHWLYEHHFAAVAGDTIAFEAWPPPFKRGPVLHEWLLAMWGTPIGELWNLEELSEMCVREKRWTFFLTSAPLHVKGGVGSPPGAIAIF